MTHKISSITHLPKIPAIYALYSGKNRPFVAYVGATHKLKNRIRQHLVRRNSSIITGQAAVRLLPDQISQVRWWHHPDFAERVGLEAAELVAFDVLQPALRSRGAVKATVQERYDNFHFYNQMKALFESQPAGQLILPDLEDAMARIEDLEARVRRLEERLGEMER